MPMMLDPIPEGAEIVPLPRVTGAQMCEEIVAFIAANGGPRIDPLDLWNSSQTGELSHVYALYWDAFAAKHGCDIYWDRNTFDLTFVRRPVSD